MVARTAGSRWTVLVAAVAGLGWGGLAATQALQAQERAPAPAVSFVTVEERDITPTETFTGRIVAVDKVELRARVDGFLEEVRFTEGADVKAGDLLFKIEDGTYAADVSAAEGRVQSAQGALRLAELERDRQRTLVERQAVAQAVLDQAEAQLTQSEGELMQEQAALQRARLNLGYTEITAPVSGRIGRSTYTVGNYVSPASDVLATIVSQDPIYVTFPVPVRQILELRKSQPGASASNGSFPVHLRLSDGERYAETGDVNFANVTVDEGTDTILVRGQIANPNRLLVDGSLVDVEVDVGEPQPTVLVPQAAVQFDQAGRYVLTLDADNKIAVARIEVGEPIQTFYAVTNGLSSGDKVVVEGIQKVRPGMEVAPTEMPMPELTEGL